MIIKESRQKQAAEWETISQFLFEYLFRATSGPREAWAILELMQMALEEKYKIPHETFPDVRKRRTNYVSPDTRPVGS